MNLKTYIEVGNGTCFVGIVDASWKWPKSSSSIGAWTYGVKTSSPPNKSATGAWTGAGVGIDGALCSFLVVVAD
jgi:hypothetical protein